MPAPIAILKEDDVFPVHLRGNEHMREMAGDNPEHRQIIRPSSDLDFEASGCTLTPDVITHAVNLLETSGRFTVSEVRKLERGYSEQLQIDVTHTKTGHQIEVDTFFSHYSMDPSLSENMDMLGPARRFSNCLSANPGLQKGTMVVNAFEVAEFILAKHPEKTAEIRAAFWIDVQKNLVPRKPGEPISWRPEMKNELAYALETKYSPEALCVINNKLAAKYPEVFTEGTAREAIDKNVLAGALMHSVKKTIDALLPSTAAEISVWKELSQLGKDLRAQNILRGGGIAQPNR